MRKRLFFKNGFLHLGHEANFMHQTNAQIPHEIIMIARATYNPLVFGPRIESAKIPNNKGPIIKITAPFA